MYKLFPIQDEIDNLKDYLEELDRSIDEYSDSVRNINGLVETNEDATKQNNTEDVTGILFRYFVKKSPILKMVR